MVEKGSLSDVQFMLETCRANINATTYIGCTPLHIASGRGDIALTAYLLSMGANPDLVTDEGDTALDLAGSDQVCVCVCVCVCERERERERGRRKKIRSRVICIQLINQSFSPQLFYRL